jgi:DNA-cytosine methyltransferase
MVLENSIYKEEKMKLKLLDLFSGIGGFSLGLESTGQFETIAFVEKDEFCQKVLKKNFNNIPIESEVRNVKGDRYAADIITGGFPCQPFSVAGKRKGKDDDRYLWDETIRVIRECKPRWFIGENVEGIINIQEGVVLRQVCDDLEKEGFEVQCLVIPASGIGAWHQRKRVWILAYSNSNRDRMRSPKAIGKRKNHTESSIGRKTVPPGNLLEMIKMYPTPTQDSASERTKKYKQGGTPLPLAVKMYPTPTADGIGTLQMNPNYVHQTAERMDK